MAVKTFEETIAGLALSAEEKKLLENTLSKNPELKQGWLRQDEFSRKMDEFKRQEAEFEETKAYKEKMEPWAEQAWETIHTLEEQGVIDKQSGKVIWNEQKSDLERQLEEARKQAVGGDMSPEELDRRVNEIVKAAGGGLSKAEMEALAASEARKYAEETFDSKYAAKEDHFNSKTIPFVTGFSTAMTLAATKYERETGKEFTDDDTKAVFELMTRTGKFNPREAVAEYMAPHLQAKSTEAEIERKAQERADAIIKQRGGLPGGGNEPYIPQAAEKGNLQMMLERSGDPTDFESVIQAQTVKAAGALRAEGK